MRPTSSNTIPRTIAAARATTKHPELPLLCCDSTDAQVLAWLREWDPYSAADYTEAEAWDDLIDFFA